MIRKILIFLVVITSAAVHSQDVKPVINGKITADLSSLDDIYVINIRTENSVQTKSGGFFEIPAIEGDTLMFSSTQIIGKRIVLKKDDFLQQLLLVKLEVLVNPLDEVIVYQHKTITAESLGIVPKGQKRFTPAERKLNAASNSYATAGLSSSAGLDPVLNWMSGRTAMLRKEAEVEKKETWLEVLSDMFAEKYLVEKLKIPADYVDGFLRYCVENNRLITTLQQKNKTMATFLMSELAVRYNEIIICESP